MISAPIILVVGLVGNALSLCVFCRKPLNTTSSTFALLSCLAVSDSLVLLTGLMRDWLNLILRYMHQDVKEFDAFNSNLILCTPFELLSGASMYCSAWILVAVAVDRFLAIRAPLQYRDLRTPQRARQLALCISLLSIGATFLMTFGNGERRECFSRDASSQAAVWLDFCGYTLVPSVLLLGFNSAMLRHYATRSRRNQHPTTRRLCGVAMTVSFSYLLMTLPNSLLLIAGELHPPLRSNQHLYLIQSATMLLWYANHAVNFVLYCLTASQVRGALRNLFSKRTRSIIT
jgi:hypothetical protein